MTTRIPDVSDNIDTRLADALNDLFQRKPG